MYRALPVSRQSLHPTNVSVKVARLRATRRFATTPTPSVGPTAEPSSAPKKKRRFFRTLVFYTTGLVAAFYAGSPLVAFNNERYHDFFYESVPLGEPILEYIEAQGWDSILRTTLFKSGQERIKRVERTGIDIVSNASERAGKAREIVREKANVAKSATVERYQDSKEKVQKAVGQLKATAGKAAGTIKGTAKDAGATVQDKASEGVADVKRATLQFSGELENLVRQAEAALAGRPVDSLPEATTTPSQPEGSPPDATPPRDNSGGPAVKDEHVYAAALPLGFEPPPGFSRPKPPAPAPAPSQSGVEAPAKPDILPLVAPAVAELTASEPVIAQLAATIDTLASFLNSNPTAANQARGILDTAKIDLTELVSRIEKAKEEERTKLEAKLDEQARDYTLQLLELQMEAQDKLDGQEEGFKMFFEEERAKFVQAYRAKLDNELQTQSELINERLKEEVIAQGIEMQRRWIREIKVRVEQERGGRLAKLDELAANLKRLERVTLDNAIYLDENLRLHALWSALRALNSAVESPVRKPFRDELRFLRHVAVARDDPIITSALDCIDATDIPDVGVEPLPALTTWFTTSVVPRVTRVALVPEQNAGLLSHLASHLLSSFRFQRRGLVEGNDTVSVLARAEYYMNEKDLDSAARELNQLKGTPQLLLRDWLAAARRRLEVLQAIEVVQAQATLASLLVV